MFTMVLTWCGGQVRSEAGVCCEARESLVMCLLHWDKVCCSSQGGATCDVVWEYDSYGSGDLFACDFNQKSLINMKKHYGNHALCCVLYSVSKYSGLLLVWCNNVTVCISAFVIHYIPWTSTWLQWKKEILISGFSANRLQTDDCWSSGFECRLAELKMPYTTILLSWVFHSKMQLCDFVVCMISTRQST